MPSPLLAAIDLGSNSFQLQTARRMREGLVPLDAVKYTVRLAEDMDAARNLSVASQSRALEALAAFGERLKGFAPDCVRVVGTSALRRAANAGEFIDRAEAVLGFPIEVISGIEEARLVYLGVAHDLSPARHPRLVIDMGGGSTEFVLGVATKPRHLESVEVGCLTLSQRYFHDGQIDAARLRRAREHAASRFEVVPTRFRDKTWKETVGSSGTARAIAQSLALAEHGNGGITRDGLEWVKRELIDAKSVMRIAMPGLKPERAILMPGAWAIFSVVFDYLDIQEMRVSEGGLRLGVLYDLAARMRHEDVRDETVSQVQARFGVDLRQAARVADTAARLFAGMAEARGRDGEALLHTLTWAARLHEVGFAIAKAGYHKHGAYVIDNTELPGFSRQDQKLLSDFVLGQRGNLRKVQHLVERRAWRVALACLRLAVLAHRSRDGWKVADARCTASADAVSLALKLRGAASAHDFEPALIEERGRWEGTNIKYGAAIRVAE